MKAISEARVRAFSHFIAVCYAEKSESKLPGLIAEKLLTLFPAKYAVHRLVRRPGESVSVVVRPEPTGGIEAFDDPLQQHPFLVDFAATEESGTRSLSMSSADQTDARSRMYLQRWKALEVTAEIGIVFVAHTSVVCVSVARCGGDFSRTEREFLELLQPHMVQAHETLFRAQRTRDVLFAHDAYHAGQGRCVVRLGARNEVRHWPLLAVRWLGEKGLPTSLLAWIETQRLAGIEDRLKNSSFAISHPDGPVSARLELEADGGMGQLILERRQTDPRASFSMEKLAPLGLPARQREVLFWAAQGKTNGEIGAIMGTATGTVKKQMEHILDHLGVDSRTAAVVRALEPTL